MNFQKNIKQWLIVVLVTVCVFLAYWFFQKQSNEQQRQPIQQIETSVQNKTLDTKRSPKIVKSKSLQISQVKSLQGSQIDGAIHLDDYGNVIVDKDLKRLFDYFLTTAGELSLEQMRNYLKGFASHQLDQVQLQQLLSYFDKYQDYLHRAETFSSSINPEMSLEEKIKLLSEFRADQLGVQMAENFFQDEQNYIQFVLGEKQSQEWTHQQQEWLLAENQSTEFQDVVIENREFNESGLENSQEVYQYRVERYGQQAADRLTQLDQQRVQWQQLLDDYIQQRIQIENQNSNLSLRQLNSQYSAQQLKRLQAQWRIHQQ